MKTFLTLLLMGLFSSPVTAQSIVELSEAEHDAKQAFVKFREHVQDRPADYYTTPIPLDSTWLKLIQTELIKDITLFQGYARSAQRALQLEILLGRRMQEPCPPDGTMQDVWNAKETGKYVDSINALVTQRGKMWEATVKRFKHGNEKAIGKFIREGMEP